MIDAISLISQDLFDKIRSRFTNLQMGDEDGNRTADPRSARFFDFDFVIENERLGSVSISINERGSLKIFYSQGILEDTGPVTQDIWFNFLREMRLFAKRRLLRFDTRDITKSNLNKTDFQYLASTGTKEDAMAESKMFGSTKTSYRVLERTKLIIRHSNKIDENQKGARSRNISAIFVENSLGERFLYPLKHLAGAKAMQRHVANGGDPYDDLGRSIINISEEISQIIKFKRQVGISNNMQTEAYDILERSDHKLENLRNHIEGLSRQKYYESWKENFSPEMEDIELDEVSFENYKNMFTQQSFKEDLAQFFPLIHRIMKETSKVDLESLVKESKPKKVCKVCKKCDCCCNKSKKEGFESFEAWANSLIEGSMEQDVLDQLKDLLMDGLPVGVDAVNAISALKEVGIDDKELFDALKKIAVLNDETDVTSTIMAWLEKQDPSAAQNLLSAASEKIEEPTTTGGAEPAAPPEQATSPEEPAMTPPSGPEATPPMATGAPAPLPAGEPTMPPGAQNAGPRTREDQLSKDKGKEGETRHNLSDVYKMVKSFYDRKQGTFPIGETGVETKVLKQFGPKAARLAKNFMQSLVKHHNENRMPSTNEDKSLNDILRLSGIKRQ